MEQANIASTVAAWAKHPVIWQGYDDYFEGLMCIVRSGAMDNTTGEKIISYTKDYVARTPFTPVNNYSGEHYVRNYIGRDRKSGWEAIIMTWKEGNVTAIHSHPQFAGYVFADGDFLVEFYEPTGDKNDRKAKKTGEIRVNSQEGYFSLSDIPGFENHIHRIRCLSPTGHSLHIYSDDALQGFRFDVI